MRKIIIGVIGILLIVGSLFFAQYLIDSKSRVRPAPPKVIKSVFVKTVSNQEVPIIIQAQGNLIAKRRIELYAEVQGIFDSGSVLFRPGQTYRKGDTLIHINADEHMANVRSAKSVLYNSIAAIMPDLRLDFPDIYDKWLSYLNSFNLSKKTPELPEMVSEKENFFITGRGIVSNYYNVKNLEQRLIKYSIVAPFDGILTDARVTEGTLIRNGQQLGSFIDPNSYEMEVAVSKTFASLLKVGESVKLNNLDKTASYTGKVTRINGSIDATTQTIQVFIEVNDSSLKQGMYLEANINAKNEKDAIELSRSLLLDSQQIFAVKDSVLDLIDVKPVFFSDTKVVLKNIPDGTVILSKPVPGAYAGMLVKPIK